MSGVKQQQPRVWVKGTEQGCRVLGVRESQPSKGRRQLRVQAMQTQNLLWEHPAEQGILWYELFKVVPIAVPKTGPLQVPSGMPSTCSLWTVLTDPGEVSVQFCALWLFTYCQGQPFWPLFSWACTLLAVAAYVTVSVNTEFSVTT